MSIKCINEYERKRLQDSLAQGAAVWWLRPESVPDDAVDRCRSVLSVDEAERVERFRFADDRRHYLLAHAMLRHALSAYADVEPAAWQFVAAAQGRPEIAGPLAHTALRFNLSHTPGLVTCIVSDGAACGVDVEAVSVRRHAMGVAERMFAEAELELLRRLDGQAFLERFFTLWTLREAWCKARGTGLTDSRRDVGFDQVDGLNWCLVPVDGKVEPGRWQLDVQHIGTTHILATAIESIGHEQVRVSYREFAFPAAAG